MKIIFDNNVLISASLLKDSTAYAAFRLAVSEHVIFSSIGTIKELFLTLTKEKFDRYVDIETRLEFIYEFREKSRITSVGHKLSICRDPKDNMFLELALSGNADLIISGDNDLLVLNPFRGIPVISPREFVDNY